MTIIMKSRGWLALPNIILTLMVPNTLFLISCVSCRHMITFNEFISTLCTCICLLLPTLQGFKGRLQCASANTLILHISVTNDLRVWQVLRSE